jgi:hypothetical protein
VFDPEFYGDLWSANHSRKPVSTAPRLRDCSAIVESTRPLAGLEAEIGMRVASLESVLTAATLVSATVVVLWGIKIFYGT